MKLMSMTEFILSDKVKSALEYEESYKMIRSYANFLKQPLKLEMFFPCDDDGNILEEPKIFDYFDDGFNFEFNQKHFKDVVLEEYYNAKEKVLFENIPIAQAKWLVNSFSTIESLSDISNTITPIYLNNNAIKQIGL